MNQDRTGLMNTFKAIVHGGSLPLKGEGFEVYFTDSQLCINGLKMIVDVESINMRVGGFEHNEFHLDWKTSNGDRYSLKPESKNDVAYVIANAPLNLKSQFKEWHKRRFTIKTVWSSLFAFVAVCLVSAVLLWFNYDAAITWVASKVSIENEEKLGASVLSEFEYEEEIIKEGLAVKSISDIGNRLTKESKYTYQWYVVLDESINAFALPGGIVIVNSGLIKKLSSADELAGVLAHEVQHVEQRHSLKHMINSLGWAAGLLILMGDVNVAMVMVVHQLGNMFFSREKEDEADRLGYDLLVKAKISPQGMLAAFKKLKGENQSDELPVWLSSHPELDERIEKINNMLKEEPCDSCQSIKMNWKKVQQDKLLSMD